MNLNKDSDNYEKVLLNVKQYGLSIKQISQRLKNDKNIIKEAVKNQGSQLKFASDELRNNKEIVK